MPGIFTSKYTGSEIEETVNARPEVISQDAISALDTANVNENKIYVLSDTAAMRMVNNASWRCINNIPYTTSVPANDNTDNLKVAILTTDDISGQGFAYYSGWIYIICDTDPSDSYVDSILIKLGEKIIHIK